MPPTIVVNLSTNAREKIGTRLGQSFAFVAFGVLIGTPIGGAVYEHRGFDALWIYGGCMIFGGGVMLIGARFSWAGWKLMKRA